MVAWECAESRDLINAIRRLIADEERGKEGSVRISIIASKRRLSDLLRRFLCLANALVRVDVSDDDDDDEDLDAASKVVISFNTPVNS